ncbi:polysaccharide deacetylase family protein [Saccharomonospora sp. NPDC046836]|uniref:polysaccharide deacetylase family protein n=1 Tax=Saccharomonospora sp. NPDC046836 TaxID=3156921 RepID=UPI0033C3E732
MAFTRALSGTGLVAAACASWQIGPAATWLPVVRRATPCLAGRGYPDRVALTFDDGPSSRTWRLLDTLAELDVQATFFMVGEYLERNRLIGEAVAKSGHEIAVHGWRHRYLLGQGVRRVSAELARARDLVADVSGSPPRWFRPPYGVLTGSALVAAARVGLQPILWTAWARDWVDQVTASEVLATLTPGLRGGATVVLHEPPPGAPPSRGQATLAALPELVAHLRVQGLTPGPLRDHGLNGRGSLGFRGNLR